MRRRFASLTLLAWLLVAACGGGPQSAAHPRASGSPSMPQPLASPSPLTQREEPPVPEPRQETAAAVLNGTIYVIGGYDPAANDTSTVFTYHGPDWNTGPPLPAALDHPAAAVVGSFLYVAGGFSRGHAIRSLYRLQGETWSQTAPLRRARGALALVAVGSRLYAIGGTNDAGDVAIPEVYDPTTDTWSDLPAMPMPRNHLAGFVYQGQACVAGGRSPNTARVDCFDPMAETWTSLPDLPEATSGAGAAVLGGEIIVAGGEGSAVIDQLARYRSGTWYSETMLLPRHGIALVVLGGRAWACGGGTAVAVKATPRCTSIGS